MRYFWTLFWVLLLVEMASYVASSMAGAVFDFKTAAVLGVLTFVLVSVIPAIIPNDPVDSHHH